MKKGERLPLDSDRLPARVARTRKPEVIPEITEEMLSLAEEIEGRDFIDLVRQLGLNSAVCVPLMMGNEVIGALSLARSAPDQPFDDDDVEVIMAVADRAALPSKTPASTNTSMRSPSFCSAASCPGSCLT